MTGDDDAAATPAPPMTNLGKPECLDCAALPYRADLLATARPCPPGGGDWVSGIDYGHGFARAGGRGGVGRGGDSGGGVGGHAGPSNVWLTRSGPCITRPWPGLSVGSA